MSVPQRSPAYRLYRLAWSSLDWIYPPYCGGCGKAGSRWCSQCSNDIQLVPDPVCARCGDIQNKSGECSNCKVNSPSFEALRSWALFQEPLRHAIHNLKYKGDVSLGEILSRPLVNMLVSFNWELDLITAVPIGVDRKAQRGYNQASLLALPLALGSRKPFRSQALVKIRETPSQIGLSYAGRFNNVAKAFDAKKDLVQGKRVLVIDDVTTSGATMDACASALFEAGSSKVFGLTLARATIKTHVKAVKSNTDV